MKILRVSSGVSDLQSVFPDKYTFNDCEASKVERKSVFFRILLMIMATGIFAGVSFGQFSINITSAGTGPYFAPFSNDLNDKFKVSATVTNPNNNTAKVVFYRNDVPILIDTSAPFELMIDALGQDYYTFRARACDTTGYCVESNELERVVHTPQVVWMGKALPRTSTVLEGPGVNKDHTDDIRTAIQYLGANGGTIFFPCKFPGTEGIARYNIRETIDIPSNITLQGEGADEANRCQISWSDIDWNPGVQSGGCYENPPIINGQPNPYYLLDKPMFRINGGNSRVRFKDMWMLSQSEGITCWRRNNYDRIRLDNNTAIEMNTKNGGSIRDVIFENVSITSFTKGISAISDNTQNDEISNVKIRGYRPMMNHRQLYIDARYAYDWDVQNLNVSSMHPTQGVVEIINAGKPATVTGTQGIIKFLQLNCNGPRGVDVDVPTCVQVQKHGGLYFRQLHHEAVDDAIIVNNISGRANTAERTNPDPIVFDGSTATGKFYDASMKLYIVGGAVAGAPEIAPPGLDEGRLRFFNAGTESTVVNCGEVHTDVTPVYPTPVPGASPTPSPTPQWHDLKMLFTHTERNRGSFFAETSQGTYIKPHTTCPAGVPGLPDSNQIGGEYFDSGNLPTEIDTYSHVLNADNCPNDQNNQEDYAACMEGFFQQGGSVYVGGSFTVNRTINVPSGSQILGTKGISKLELIHNQNNVFGPLLRINILLPSGLYRVSNVVIRDLALMTQQTGNVGISIINGIAAPVQASSDFHFSRLTIEGFEKGIYAGEGDPMIDGISLKNLSFIDNQIAVDQASANSSNWNIMNLSMKSKSQNAEGWYQTTGGHQAFQRVTCQGTSGNKMKNCIRLSRSSMYLTDLQRTEHVTNALTVEVSAAYHSGIYLSHIPSTVLLRNNDFTSVIAGEGRVKIAGKALITSMNNKYQYFDVQTTDEGNLSRLTYCGDTYSGSGNTVYPGLADAHPNLWVWVPTPTRIECGTRPVPWEDAVRLGGQPGDVPMVGNFSDDLREDFVIYRPGTAGSIQSKFLIKQSGGHYSRTINWGMVDDLPLIGKFFPNSRSQIVIFRPSTGYWWEFNPQTDTYNGWHWGQNGDVPLVGNFLDESGTVSGNMDEIAVYRPSTSTFYIQNPRSLDWDYVTNYIDPTHSIRVGDFKGIGRDQIADYDPATGEWDIIDPITKTVVTVALSTTTTGDVPVPGRYFPAAFGFSACTQIGVWRPSTQQFIVEDAFSTCGSRAASVVWGSNNDFNNQTYQNDIPLTISTTDGTLRRPAAYRPTKGAFPESIADGQWWVHDPLVP